MNAAFAIVDLFAGPGGLAEGFSAYETVEGTRPFSVRLSVEKEKSAHQTLSFRAFLRQFGARFPQEYYDWLNNGGAEPDWQALYPAQWKAAGEEALCLTLGDETAGRIISRRIGDIRKTHGRNTVLIGGPPCQAYSLVGRVRSRGKVGYVPEDDARHYLFREYIRVLDKLRPAAFVMENVKGMLSSTVESRLVFEMLMEDLSSLGTGHAHHYKLRAVRVEDGKASLQDCQRYAYGIKGIQWVSPPVSSTSRSMARSTHSCGVAP
jgi:DNA (cytosine-5)-methyltransferase 1